MTIACLAWGSLIWDPRTLPHRRPWFADGPLLPVEFVRHSNGDCVTLVIADGFKPVRVLWALMPLDDLTIAKKELAQREGISNKYVDRDIGSWASGISPTTHTEIIIADWARQEGIDTVVWTALTPKWDGKNGNFPSCEELLLYLRNLTFERQRNAKEYIRRAPLQIDTDYRRRIELEFGWTPIQTTDFR